MQYFIRLPDSGFSVVVVVELGLSAGGSSKSRGLYTILGPPSRHCMKFVPKVLNPDVKPFSKLEIKSNIPEIT